MPVIQTEHCNTMDASQLVFVVALLSSSARGLPPPIIGHQVQYPIDTALDTFHGNLSHPPPPEGRGIACDGVFFCLWMDANGNIHNNEEPEMLELSATIDISSSEHETGADIVSQMLVNSPPELFGALIGRGTVGFFTFNYATTIFPEYLQYRDRPECTGTCAGPCSNTCTGDGRKYDSLAGLGGSRGTCVDVNYMCKPSDPYNWQYNVLVHEFAHTVHQYALPYVSPGGVNYWQEIYNAWNAARSQGTWDINSYAMVNHLEYFAEAAGVFFNVNNHPNSSGGMNSCGQSSGFCRSETEARNWLEFKDPALFEALSYTFTDYRPHLLSGMTICP